MLYSKAIGVLNAVCTGICLELEGKRTDCKQSSNAIVAISYTEGSLQGREHSEILRHSEATS